MHIAQHIIQKKKLEDEDEIPNYTSFEKQFDRILP